MVSNKKGYTIFLHTFMIILCLLCVVPFILLVIVSLSSETSLLTEGYSFFPEEFSAAAYQYLFASPTIYQAYGYSLFVTAVGTAASVVITTLLAYPLAIRELPGRKFFNFAVFFTMLFSGGLVPSYMMWTQTFGIKNTVWAYIIPNLVTNGFIVMIMRTYFETNIPKELLESGRIDGASEFKILLKVVLPVSLPIIATIGLMSGMTYWNDWSNGLYYITDKKLYTVQVFLNNMLLNAQQLDKLSGSHLDMNALPTTAVRMAVAVAGALPLMCIYPFFQKYFIKGMTIGAVKG